MLEAALGTGSAVAWLYEQVPRMAGIADARETIRRQGRAAASVISRAQLLFVIGRDESMLDCAPRRNHGAREQPENGECFFLHEINDKRWRKAAAAGRRLRNCSIR
jgi:hypothetical protein